jgi:hypothetical protein
MKKSEAAELYQMNEAEKLFSDVVGRSFRLWSFISSFRMNASEAMVAAKDHIREQRAVVVEQILYGSRWDRIFFDKEGFFKAMPPEKMISQMTELAMTQTQAAVDAASIVFAHSLLDGAAIDFCRVTALVAPQDWESEVDQRQVKLCDMRVTTYEEMLKKKVDEFLEQLDRESLLKKADLLLARCKPPAKWSPMNNYAYDRGRLESLDGYRHGVIHGERLGLGIAQADEDLSFLQKTLLFFMGVVNYRYKLKIVADYAFGVNGGP